MKATGIVRKIDDLGRCVIPKEIRISLGIDIDDPVEFYVDDQCVIIKKYDAASGMEQLLDNLESSIRMKSSLLPPAKCRDLLVKMKEMKTIIKGG